MEATIFPRQRSIFKETRDLQTLLLSGISYLTGDLLLREPPPGIRAGTSQSQPLSWQADARAHYKCLKSSGRKVLFELQTLGICGCFQVFVSSRNQRMKTERASDF